MIELSALYNFLLIFVRLLSFFVSAPVFSSKGVPVQFKIGLAFFIAFILYPNIGMDMDEIITIDGNYLFSLIQETLLGLVLGWLAQLMFTSIQIAGSFVDMQIGFAIANVIDPQTGAQTPLMGNFKYIFAVLLFLALDWHHLFIDGIISSYHLLPPNGHWIEQLNNESMITFIMSVFTRMFVIAFKMAAPIVGTLFITDAALGIVSRTVPQLNVFVVGMPLKVIINFILYILIAPSLIYLFKEVFEETIISIKQFMDLMG